jgi:hypothetical protein
MTLDLNKGKVDEKMKRIPSTEPSMQSRSMSLPLLTSFVRQFFAHLKLSSNNTADALWQIAEQQGK